MRCPPSPGPGAAENRILRLLTSEHLVLGLSVVYFAALAPFTPGFATSGNLANLAASLLPLFVLAAGQTVVLIGGGIDLSATSVVGLCSITGAAIMSADSGWLGGSPIAVPVAIAAMLLTGGTVGLLNGLAVTRLRMPAFIVTLTSMMFFSGLAIWLTQSRNIGNLPSGFNLIGGKTPVVLAVAVGLGAALHLMLSRSLWGRWLFAVGQNRETARVSGVPVGRVGVSVYVVSGLCAACASVLYTGQAESGSPVLGQRLLLDVIGATVIGGTSLFGGKGKLIWTLFGVIFIKLIDNSLNLLDLSYFSIMTVKGLVILFAASIDALRNRDLT